MSALVWFASPVHLEVSSRPGSTCLVAGMTLVSGRAHRLLGVVHLVIFAAFLFMAFQS
jgi:hypothetical protein